MEGLFAVLIGALAIATAPLVPVVRPVAKAAVMSGLAIADAATVAAAAAGHQLEHLRARTKAEGYSMAASASVGDDVAFAADVEAASATAAVAADVVATVVDADIPVCTASPPMQPMQPMQADVVATVVDADAPAPADDQPEEPTSAQATLNEGIAADDAFGNPDDLTGIGGVGPKVADVLVSAGITTYAQLAATSEEQLREILAAAGPRYRAMDPASWPEQARRLLSPD
jgi:predicted flap endonuclease-1-like 5' DNA nuclease